MKTRTKLYYLATTITLLLVSIACQLIGFSQEQPIDSPTSPVITQTGGDLPQETQAAGATAQNSGTIYLVLTEEQITSLAAAQIQSQPESNISDLQVHLRNDQMQITGTVIQNGLKLPLNLILAISVQTGKPSSSVVSASIGPFSLPESVLDQITTQLDQALSDQLTANLILDQITIDAGRMTIEGHMF
jgi:uncharacterized protein YpmS